jgi:hypothetical protein
VGLLRTYCKRLPALLKRRFSDVRGQDEDELACACNESSIVEKGVGLVSR